MSARTTFAGLSDGWKPIPRLLDEMFADTGKLGVIPCTASGVTTIALTALTAVYAPAIATYSDNLLFSFAAAGASGGNVTINVSGVGAKNLYHPDGTTRVTTGDLASGSFNIVAYGSTLNAGAGGFYLASGSTHLPGLTISDATFSIIDDGDATKVFKFQLSGLTTATTRTWAVPDASSTFVGTDTTQTLSNKTLASPAVTGTLTLTSSNSQALIVGPNGATNPTFRVNPSVASAATGVFILANAAAAGVDLGVLSSGTDENLRIDAKGAGTITLGTASTGAIAINRSATVAGTVTVTSSSASALTAGLAGATNPALQVDASTASSATGIKIKSAAAAAGLAVSVISSGTNESLTLDAKGSGTITLGTTSTGNISILRATTITAQSASAFALGRQGATSPALVVDSNTANSATGIRITALAATFGAAIDVVSSGTNEQLFIDAKGSGAIAIGQFSTGAIALSRNTTVAGTLIQTSNDSQAFIVGPNGTTNPVLRVNASVASAATGLSILANAAAAGLDLSVLSSGSNENLRIDSKGSGTITLNSTGTGAIALSRNTTVAGTATVTSSNAAALTVGLNGATNPALTVDASTGSSATGVRVKSAAAAGGVDFSVLSSGSNDSLRIDAKGTGSITLGNTSTGAVIIRGTSTNDDAASGFVGEFGSVSIAVGAAVSLTNNTAKTIATLSLPSGGDYDVHGNVIYKFGATTTVTEVDANISDTTDTFDGTVGTFTTQLFAAGFTPGGSAQPSLSTPAIRKSIAASGNRFLIAFCSFGTSTATAYGFARYRRMR